MKRFLALAVGLMLLGVTGVAHAGPAAVKWVYEPLMFRTQTAATVIGSLDSSYFSQSALRSDTTVAVQATSQWALPNLDVSAADSTVWAMLYVKGRAGATTTQGTDSIYVDVQVSIDGSHWITVTPTRNFNSGGTTHDGAIYIEQSSADSYGVPIKIVVGGTGLAVLLDSATAPSALRVWGWPFVRFIINSDANGQFVAEVGHWAPI